MCDCIKKANEALAAKNTRLDTRMMLNIGTGRTRQALLVPTVKLDSRKKEKPLRVAADFCPFCGVKTI